jgi:hypothetical protein
MEFLVTHWHCVVPVAAILIGVFIMGRGKPKGKGGDNDNAENRAAAERKDSYL